MLQSFFATFGKRAIPDMSPGHKYLVTFNGADTPWDDAIDAIFDADNSMADMPAPPGGGHNPTASDILGNTVPMYTPEQEEEMELWTEDGDLVVAPGPASTEELREYRFKPNLF